MMVVLQTKLRDNADLYVKRRFLIVQAVIQRLVKTKQTQPNLVKTLGTP